MRWSTLALSALLTLPALSAGAQSVDGQSVSELRGELGLLSDKVNTLEREYLAPELLERNYQFTSRLSEGQLLYLREDYLRAAMVLLDLVEDPQARARPGYKDAITYLADSLYRIRNYNAASRYYEILVTEGSEDQQQQGVGRLLEIALITEDEEAARALLGRAGTLLAGNPDPALLYTVGKYYHREGNITEARKFLNRVPWNHAYGRRARYYEGVLLVTESRYNEALERFIKVATPAEKPAQPAGAREARVELTAAEAKQARTDAQVMDMARLAQARLHYERGEFDAAIDAYATISRDSTLFDDALYESVWISVKQNRYEDALRRLEILTISQPDVVQRPETWMLKGQLLMMLEQHADASLAFQEVLFEFGPIQAEMQRVIDEHPGQLEAYFNRVIGDNLVDFELSSLLPPRAAEFAGPEVETDRALGLVGELAAERRSIDDARRIIDRLDVAVNADNRVEIFPKLHEGWLAAMEVQARVVRARAALHDALGAQTSDSTLAGLAAERRKWMKAFEKVPTSAVQLRARDAFIDEQMATVDAEAFKRDIEIESLQAQLVAIEVYVRDTRDDEALATRRATVLKQASRQLEMVKALRAELEEVRRQIDAERMQVGANDYATAQDDRIRRKVVSALDREARQLAALGRGVPADLKTQSDEIERRARAFMSTAARLVDEKVADIRRQLVKEKARIDQYEGQLMAYQGETESLSGRIAARSFRSVLRQVDAVVLEADVGLIDVAWKQKKDQSDQITRQLARQSEELRALERDYRELGYE